jgi:hypothetical protein
MTNRHSLIVRKFKTIEKEVEAPTINSFLNLESSTTAEMLQGGLGEMDVDPEQLDPGRVRLLDDEGAEVIHVKDEDEPTLPELAQYEQGGKSPENTDGEQKPHFLEEEEKKPQFETTYEGFSIFGKILVVM